MGIKIRKEISVWWAMQKRFICMDKKRPTKFQNLLKEVWKWKQAVSRDLQFLKGREIIDMVNKTAMNRR